MRRQRFNAGDPLVVHPIEPLRDALIVWDMRSWNGMTDDQVIENQGIAGSDFDLIISGNNDTLNSVVALGNIVGNWTNHFGGPPCDGPFTVMAFRKANGATLQRAALGWPDVNTGTSSRIGFLAASNVGINFQAGGSVISNVISGTNWDSWVATYDPVDGGSTIWVDDTPVSPTRTGGVNSCALVPNANGVNVQFGLTSTFAAPDSPPEAGLVGFVFARGEPDPATFAYWDAYFAAPAYNPFSYVFTSQSAGIRTWYDSDYCYHWINTGNTNADKANFTAHMNPISGAALPATIDFLLIGGGEQSRGGTNVNRGGGGGAGEIIPVFGHPAPTSTTSLVKGVGVASIVNKRNSFEGYTADGFTPNFTSFSASVNGGNVAPNASSGPYYHLGGTGTASQAGGGGGGALSDGGDNTGTTPGAGGDGYPSAWHWSGAVVYHCGGGAGRGSGATIGAFSEPRGLGYGAHGANSSPTLVQGMSGGLVVRYERQD